MKHIVCIIFLCLLLSGVSFCQYDEVQDQNKNCAFDSTGLIPVNDLGEGIYLNRSGGLFGNGLNKAPAEHRRNGIKISKRIVPLNDEGRVDWEEGQILVVGMGASVASNAFNTFIDSMKVQDWPGANPCLRVKGLFLGGKDLNAMVDENSDVRWADLKEKMDDRGDSWKEVQVVWMMQSGDIPLMDMEAVVDTTADMYTILLQRMLDSMPNLKQVYLSSLHYTGYTSPDHDRYDNIVEPKGYWGGYAIQEVIMRQMNGDPDLVYMGREAKVPYVTWGPYFWADGKNPRESDGLTWMCDEFRDDDAGGGFHLTDAGKYKEALMIQAFFESDPVARKWYRDADKWSVCNEEETIRQVGENLNRIHIYPNPASEYTQLFLPYLDTDNLWIEIYSLSGALIERFSSIPGRPYMLQTADYAGGMYLVRVSHEGETWTGRFIVE